MKVIIENGVTVIKTGDPNGGIKNKYNQTGVSQQFFPEGVVKYRAEIQIKGIKYYLGIRDTAEEAGRLRQEAEKQIADGNFEKWLETVKNPDTYNKFNRTGISECKMPNGSVVYRAEIKHNGQRHYIAKKKDLQDAINLLEEAKKHAKQGNLEEWLKSIKRKPKTK